MAGFVLMIFWIVLFAVFAATGKNKRRTAAQNKAPQKTAPVRNSKSTVQKKESTVRSSQSTAWNSQSTAQRNQNTVRSGQSTVQSSQSNIRSGQSVSQSKSGYGGRRSAENRRNMTKYSRMGSTNERNTGRKNQTMYRQNTGVYSQSPSDLEEDILTRANRNIQQQFAEDVLEQGQKEITGNRAEQKTMSVEENTDLIKEVFDLIIVGPDTSTYFDRDFVAEGIEMVNRGLESV